MSPTTPAPAWFYQSAGRECGPFYAGDLQQKAPLSRDFLRQLEFIKRTAMETKGPLDASIENPAVDDGCKAMRWRNTNERHT